MGRRLFSVCGQVVLTVLAMAAADCPGCSSFVLTQDERALSSSPEVRSPIPVIAPPPGWVLGSEHSNAPIVMEVFLDLVCPDSARAWPMLHQLRQAYTNEDLKIVVHIYQLPYHINAYTISQGYHLVKTERPEYLEAYVNVFYEHLSNFTTANTADLSNNEVIDRLSTYVAGEHIMDKDEFKSKIAGYYSDVQKRWKFASRRGVAGTPWYFVNGVDLALDPNLTYDLGSWTTYIEGLLK